MCYRHGLGVPWLECVRAAMDVRLCYLCKARVREKQKQLGNSLVNRFIILQMHVVNGFALKCLRANTGII